MAEATLLKNSLITTRTFVALLGEDPCGSIISAMNEVLWNINETGVPGDSLQGLREALTLTELSSNSNFIEPVVFNFAQSFLITIDKKWREDEGAGEGQPEKLFVLESEPLPPSSLDPLPSSSADEAAVFLAVIKQEIPDTTRENNGYGEFRLFVDPNSNGYNDEGQGEMGQFGLEEEAEDDGEEEMEEEPEPTVMEEKKKERTTGKRKVSQPTTTKSLPMKKGRRSTTEKDSSSSSSSKSKPLNDDKCSFCPHRFSQPVTNKKIYMHLFKRHNSIPGTFFRCFTCNKNFNTSDHEKTCNGRFEFHYDPTPLKRTPRVTGLGDLCPFCDKVLAATKGMGISIGAISDHIQRKHADVPGTFFRCSKCPDTLARQRTQLYYHHKNGCDGDVEYHHDPSGSFTSARRSATVVDVDTCQFCDKMLASRKGEGVTLNQLSQHIMVKHGSLPGTFFRCSVCLDFRKRDRSAIYSHMQTQECGGSIEYFYDAEGQYIPSNKRIPIIKEDNCPLCGEVLSSGGGVLVSRLADHLSRMHHDTRGSFFRCSTCHDARARDRVSIREHIKSTNCEGKIEYFHDETYIVTVGKPRVSIIDGDSCPLCSERLVDYDGEAITKKRLYEHFCKSHQDMPGTFFRCSQCTDFKARDTYKVYMHYKEENCGGTTQFHYDPAPSSATGRGGFIAGDNCPFCDLKLTNFAGEGITQSRLVDHLSKKHHSLPGSFLRCSVCTSTRSRDLSRLYTHIKEEECGGKIEYFYDATPLGGNGARGSRAMEGDECPFCDEVLAQFEGDGIAITRLADHITKNHHTVPGTFFRCSVCTDIQKRDRPPLYMHIRHEDCGGKIEYFYDPEGQQKRAKEE